MGVRRFPALQGKESDDGSNAAKNGLKGEKDDSFQGKGSVQEPFGQASDKGLRESVKQLD